MATQLSSLESVGTVGWQHRRAPPPPYPRQRKFTVHIDAQLQRIHLLASYPSLHSLNCPFTFHQINPFTTRVSSVTRPNDEIAILSLRLSSPTNHYYYYHPTTLSRLRLYDDGAVAISTSISLSFHARININGRTDRLDGRTAEKQNNTLRADPFRNRQVADRY